MTPSTRVTSVVISLFIRGAHLGPESPEYEASVLGWEEHSNLEKHEHWFCDHLVEFNSNTSPGMSNVTWWVYLVS